VFLPENDKECCVGCGECVAVCPQDVWEIVGGKATPVNSAECIGCESCIEVCEQDCITIREA
jgi:NAD-dependent dihydropyrimidine dehydrogenase PreA subunit